MAPPPAPANGSGPSQGSPPVLSADTVRALDEYLRFRHVVRNIYAFEFDKTRIEHLVERLGQLFNQVRAELLNFADFLEQAGQDG